MLQCIDGLAIDNIIKENKDQDDLLNTRKIAFLNTLIVNVEVFKLVIVNKFFYKKKKLEMTELLRDTKTNCLINIDKIKEEIQFYKYHYNIDVIFQTGTTTKKLHKNILNKLDVDNYELTVENKIKKIETINEKIRIIDEKKEIDKKDQGSNIIGLIGLFYTIVFGYDQINNFVNSVLVKFNISIVNNHPVRVTMIIWGSLIIVIFIAVKKHFF